jgi:hypothetical protein
LLSDGFNDRGVETDMIEIEIEGDPSFRRIGKMSKDDSQIRLLNTEFDLDPYDIVIIGSPVWAGNPSVPLVSFLERSGDGKGRRTGIFMTGMRATRKNDRTIEALVQRLSDMGYGANIGNLILKFRRGRLVEGEESISDFVDGIVGEVE